MLLTQCDMVNLFRNGGDCEVCGVDSLLALNAVLQRFVMQGPIPLQTEFIDGSAVAPRADGLEVLVDDLGWQTPPVKRRLKDANGATIDQIVPPTEYRALRWPIAGDLLSNQTITASYRVRVNR